MRPCIVQHHTKHRHGCNTQHAGPLNPTPQAPHQAPKQHPPDIGLCNMLGPWTPTLMHPHPPRTSTIKGTHLVNAVADAKHLVEEGRNHRVAADLQGGTQAAHTNTQA
jgi:hypothetical protein